MTVWLALLRGINVGGNNIIPMKALAETFTRLGFESVRTYIASGNVLFRSPEKDPRALEKKLERAISSKHACDVKVVVRTREELAALVDDLPRGWKKPDPKTKRYYVVFLRHAVDSESVLDRLEAKPGVEELAYRRGALLWSANIAQITRSSVAKLVASALYKDVTIRNLSTTLTLRKLADAMATAAPAPSLTSPRRTTPSSPRRRARTSR